MFRVRSHEILFLPSGTSSLHLLLDSSSSTSTLISYSSSSGCILTRIRVFLLLNQKEYYKFNNIFSQIFTSHREKCISPLFLCTFFVIYFISSDAPYIIVPGGFYQQSLRPPGRSPGYWEKQEEDEREDQYWVSIN